MKEQIATFGGGCFWHVQENFDSVPGVISTRVGYTGGDFKDPTYEDVHSGKTGHVEAVEITFDPEKISYEELLEIFWKKIDPTAINRQGPDIGSQYQSVIFYHNDIQKKLARMSKEKIEESLQLDEEIATQIRPASTFYEAEEYHQKYIEKTGRKVC